MHSTHSKLDLNLLVALDALLEEGSVAGAALRLHLSAPAMSRTLARIRRALGDPVLVRSGQAMVPTPRALAVRAEVHELVERAVALFSPSELDLGTLERTFTLQADDSIIMVTGTALLERIRREAPGAALRFLPEGPDDTGGLRDGRVDLEIGVIDGAPPEVRVEPLYEDDQVGVVRAGHPFLDGEPTAERFAAAEHLTVSRRGRFEGPIDARLAERGLRRRVVASAPTFSASLFMLSVTDLVGRAGRRSHAATVDRLGLVAFDLPVEAPSSRVAMAWHRRYEADVAHAWLRRLVREVVAGIVDRP
ncbi:LysR family transcriptional regulator [Actinoallomurus soli]|uniref:LysR family transcriptional regulator n=1 Tax=Actinoallomurus soli TaxID=2952535 RepID=UPI0020936885|nr:LysR family transcriptional regulator [Actinoallomurus soli]MCO5966909.1 LysR family transcriptional regulator [Actinoallomurus soli]